VAVLAPGTVVETLAERREAEGQVWQRVRLADGREGWLPLPALGGEPGRR
jgi:SH3-like domain-containing protein